ncbi:MAG: histone deacetylase family protein [Methylophilaceae bacterium]
MQTAYITHPMCLKHDNGPDHPESPARLHAIEDQLIASRIFDYLAPYAAQQATMDQLLMVHDADYIHEIAQKIPSGGLVHLDNDLTLNPYSLEAALYAAGSVVQGIDLVMAGTVANAFCNIRPPGHHAERNRGMGFSLFNNVAVGAAYALERYKLTRIAILDFDVHHGNGTDDIFHEDSRVLFCSSFQHPLYPYCGLESANEHIINVPLAAGCSGDDFREAVAQHWLPALHDFKPQLILISAGFDAHREDDMARLGLKESDYAWVTQLAKDVATQYAEGRIVSVLEGGYALSALGRSALAHIKVLSGL